MSAAGVEFISISDEDDGAGGGDESAAGAACAGDRDREMAGAPSRASVCVQCRDVRLSERAGTADTADGVQTSHRRTRTYVLHVSVSARRPVAVPVLVRYFDRSLTQRRRRARMIGHDRRGKRAYRMPAGRRRRSQQIPAGVGRGTAKDRTALVCYCRRGMDVPCVHPNGADRPTLLLRVRVHACRRTISSFWTAACLPACTPEVILDRPLPQQLGRLQLTAPPGYMLIWAGPLRFRSSEERASPPPQSVRGQASKRYFIHVNYMPVST